jgi:tagaturonate reductase
MVFYRGNINGRKIALIDEDYVLSFFNTNWEKVDKDEMKLETLVNKFLSSEMIWGEDLTRIKGLAEKTTHFLERILFEGMLEVVKSVTFIEV